MNITAYFSQIGVPKTGLSPTINIRDISDGSLTVNAAAMTEVGDGFYWYNFSGYNPAKDYSIRCNGGATLFDSDRYAIASTGFPADGSGFTALGDTRVANLDAAISSRATEAKQDIIDTNVDQIETAVITNAAGVDIAADIIALKAETVLIVADTNELQTDDIPGTLATIAGYIDTEIGTIITAVETTIPNSIAALPTDADVNAACDLAISDAALATAAILKEVNQSLNGAKCVIDRAASTFKVYDTDGTTLLFTITKATVGNVDTLTRT